MPGCGACSAVAVKSSGMRSAVDRSASTIGCVALEVTQRCNLACAHCYISAGSWHTAAGELSTAECRRITDEIIDIYVEQLARAAPDTILGLSHYMHGEVCRVKPDATAFPHRQAHSIHLRCAWTWNDPQHTGERFARGDPLYRVHECAFGVLALESEPVDPRL